MKPSGRSAAPRARDRRPRAALLQDAAEIVVADGVPGNRNLNADGVGAGRPADIADVDFADGSPAMRSAASTAARTDSSARSISTIAPALTPRDT